MLFQKMSLLGEEVSVADVALGCKKEFSPLYNQEVTKRCRLSWLTNSALVYEPKCGGRGLRVLSQ
jgi:hypothetical protein